MVSKLFFCSEFPDIPDKVARKTRKTQAIAKRYSFHTNAKKNYIAILAEYPKLWGNLQIKLHSLRKESRPLIRTNFKFFMKI